MQLVAKLLSACFFLGLIQVGLAQQLSCVTLDPTTVTGGQQLTATIKLVSDALADVNVKLSTGDPSVSATTPTAVTIAQGTQTVVVTLQTSPVTSDKTDTITVVGSQNTVTASLLIQSPRLSTFTVSPASTYGGGSIKGSIVLTGPAPTGGLIVPIASDSGCVFPTGAKVPAGKTSAVFTLSTVPVAQDTTANLTANFVNQIGGTVTVMRPRVVKVVLAQPSVVGGTTVSCTLTLNSPAPSQFSVAVASTNPAVATPPAIVAFGAQSKSVTVSISANPVPVDSTASITAEGGTVASSTLTVLAPVLASLKLNAPGKTPETFVVVSAGTPVTATLTINHKAPAGFSVPISIAKDSSAYATLAQSPVTFVAGQTVATVQISTWLVVSDLTVNVTGAGKGGIPVKAAMLLKHAGLADAYWPKAFSGTRNSGQSALSGRAVTNMGVLLYDSGLSPFRAPVVGPDGTIYMTESDANTNDTLVALDPATLTPKWKVSNGNFMYGTPAVAADGTIYATSTDGNVYCICPTGVVRWQGSVGEKLFAPITIGNDGTIFFCSRSTLYAFHPNLQLKWSVALANGQLFALGSGSSAEGLCPAIGFAGEIVLTLAPNGSETGGVIAFDYCTGALLWTFTDFGGDTTDSAAAVSSDGMIYLHTQTRDPNTGLPSAGHLYALQPAGYSLAKPRLHWKKPVDVGPGWSVPSISSNGRLIVLADLNKNMSWVSDAGSLEMQFVLNAGVSYCSAAVTSDGASYIVDDNGYVYSFDASFHETGVVYSPRFPNPAPDEAVTSPAIGLNGTLYFFSQQGNLHAIQVVIPA